MREALHAQLEVIFDSEFIHAYNHGIVLPCFDEEDRRFYPRVFIISADYKDKCITNDILYFAIDAFLQELFGQE